MLLQLQPMLASSGPIRGCPEEYAFEPKFDGWRALVYADDGVTIRTRNGHNVTEALPEFERLASALQSRSAVLDGELVANQGRAWEFYRLGPRLAAKHSAAVTRARVRTPVSFVAFDVLWLDGELLTVLPLVRGGWSNTSSTTASTGTYSRTSPALLCSGSRRS